MNKYTLRLIETHLIVFKNIQDRRFYIEEYQNTALSKIFIERKRDHILDATDIFFATASCLEHYFFPHDGGAGVIGTAGAKGTTHGYSGAQGAILVNSWGPLNAPVNSIEQVIATLKEYDKEDLPLLIGFFKHGQMQEALARVLSDEV